MKEIPISHTKRRQLAHGVVVPTLDLRPFIDGEFVTPLSKSVIPVTDPMTEQVVAVIPLASVADVDAAVSAARTAFDEGAWTDWHARMRAKFLYRLAHLIERDMTSIALLEAADTGKSYRGVLSWNIPNAAEVYRYYAGWTDKMPEMPLPS